MLVLPVGAETVLFDATSGYRIAQLRSPTPSTVPGGRVVTLEEVQRLVRESHAILIDVMPSDGAGLDVTTGAWHMAKPRLDMAGSIWLPDVGRGVLSAQLDAYFRANLERLTAGDTSRPIILYCQADCWMSWNAVKRAASYGYSALAWYPEGTDGMRDWDVPLVTATPVPVGVEAR